MLFSRNVLKVCRASDVDTSILSTLASRTFRESHSSRLSSATIDQYVTQMFSLEQQKHDLSNAKNLILFAADDGIPCGYIMLCSDASSPLIRSDRPIHLARLYLLHDWMGQGLGSHLMGTALRYARLNGGEDCWLRVWMDNHHAIKFYRHWGFEDIGCSTIWIGQTAVPCLVMARSLS